jgi:hypothetical protein
MATRYGVPHRTRNQLEQRTIESQDGLLNEKRRQFPDAFWWTGRELNPRHMDFQSIALPTELPVRTILRNSEKIESLTIDGNFVLLPPRGMSIISNLSPQNI